MFCKKCDISIKSDFTPCPRSSDKESDILFISDTPTQAEVKQQCAFGSSVHKLLNEYIDKISIRSFSNFTNIVKCATDNRAPSINEYNNCISYLIDDLSILKPKIVILVGKTAYECFYNKSIEYYNKVVNKPVKSKHFIIIPIYASRYILKEDKESKYIYAFNMISDIYNSINPYYSKVNI